MKKWLKEPLIAFLALGALIFGLANFVGEPAANQVVEVDQAEINRLIEQWRAQMGRAPSEAELDGLVEQFLREEIYYREALRLSLDQGDVIVRRRLVQKLTFLTEDLATSQPPTQAELRAFYQTNLGRYELPKRFSFLHRYFSVDRRDDAQADAVAALADPSISGDPFMLQRAYAERSERKIGVLFGRGFAASVAALTPSPDWQGPIRSAYGWHLVRLEQIQPSRLPPFEDMAVRVAADLNAQHREDANRAFYEQLRSRYQVLRP